MKLIKEDVIVIVTYGEKNISINKGDEHIVLSNEEVGFLLRSLLKNIDLVEIKTK